MDTNNDTTTQERDERVTDSALSASPGSYLAKIRKDAARFFWQSRGPISQPRKDNFKSGFETQRSFAKALEKFLSANSEHRQP